MMVKSDSSQSNGVFSLETNRDHIDRNSAMMNGATSVLDTAQGLHNEIAAFKSLWSCIPDVESKHRKGIIAMDESLRGPMKRITSLLPDAVCYSASSS